MGAPANLLHLRDPRCNYPPYRNPRTRVPERGSETYNARRWWIYKFFISRNKFPNLLILSTMKRFLLIIEFSPPKVYILAFNRFANTLKIMSNIFPYKKKFHVQNCLIERYRELHKGFCEIQVFGQDLCWHSSLSEARPSYKRWTRRIPWKLNIPGARIVSARESRGREEHQDNPNSPPP